MTKRLGEVVVVVALLCVLAAAETRGEVMGKAMLVGPAPAAKKGAPAGNQQIVLGPKGELQDVVVYVKDGAKLGGAVPKAPAALTIKGGRYEPHVLAAMVGQGVEISNKDANLHVPVALAKQNAGEVALHPGVVQMLPGATTAVETYRVRCGVYAKMVAWVVVLDHPFFAVTGADGQFEIPNLPPGKHKLVAWHERLGEREADVEVGKDQKVIKAAEISFGEKK
jgi:hypothetical protein